MHAFDCTAIRLDNGSHITRWRDFIPTGQRLHGYINGHLCQTLVAVEACRLIGVAWQVPACVAK